MWDCTASKMHLTQAMYMICTWDWQQNLTYVWYVAPSIQKSTLTCSYALPTIYWLKGKKELNLCIRVEHFSPCDRSDDISISGSEALPTYWLSVCKLQAPPTYYYLSRWVAWSGEFTTFWSDFICKIVKGMRKILSYALKMRQDYLSTRYLDQFISPSFCYAHSRDIFDPSN